MKISVFCSVLVVSWMAVVSTALAGGIDLSGQPHGLLFTEGRYAEISISTISPKVSGSYLGTMSSGDIGQRYDSVGAGLKADFNGKLSYAIILDQPFAGDLAYPSAQGIIPGTRAQLESLALTTLVRWKIDRCLSLFAGPRLQSVTAEAAVPIAADYIVTGDRDYALGYTVGIAYLLPRIEGRVSLAYNSKVKHKLDTLEQTSLLGVNRSKTAITTPRSVNLEFQTGIMTDTLLFGSLRWVEWDGFNVRPADYVAIVGDPLVEFEHNALSYELGVGYRFSPVWSGAIWLGYEKQDGGIQSNLSPKDGRKVVGLGATYRINNLRLSAGISYIAIGDATSSGAGGVTGQFRGNSAVSAGTKIGYYF